MENILAQLKPNAKKILLFTFSKILFISLIVGGLFYLLRSFVDFSIFTFVIDTLNTELGLNLTIPNITQYIPTAVSITFLVLLSFFVLEYNILTKIIYLFHPDGFYFYENDGIFKINEKFIPYSNVVRMTFDKLSILSSGNITIDLTGMDKTKITLKFIDYPEPETDKLLKIINNYRAAFYAKKSEDYKYEQILNRESF